MDRIPMTASGYKALEEEISHLKLVERPAGPLLDVGKLCREGFVHLGYPLVEPVYTAGGPSFRGGGARARTCPGSIQAAMTIEIVYCVQ